MGASKSMQGKCGEGRKKQALGKKMMGKSNTHGGLILASTLVFGDTFIVLLRCQDFEHALFLFTSPPDQPKPGIYKACDMEALYPSSEFNLKEVPRGHLSYLIGGGGVTVSVLFVCWMLYVLMNKYNFAIGCKCSISKSQLRDIESQANDI
ncbi:hypothetical protein NC653_012312 [Populus alba x Populus x berolinensis]|uniref:Uncharacterized protein n=1 Tax=Populus alba x Populus x berolinensis TaxID=444605 RepID=A0AAD6R4J8_9ROSI|nr:hypothetical protein NC653_012312 [Populus alba x Populus x berolinensis]